MKKRPIEKMLDIIISKDESIIRSSSYQRVKKALEKKTEDLTYADKYALMKAYKIITGDDPDQNLSEELKAKKRMESAYPSRAEMEKFVAENYDTENLTKILDYYKVNSLGELKLEELIVCYNRKKK